MKYLSFFVMLMFMGQSLTAQYDCSGVKATIISQNSSSAQVEVEVSNGHQINPPGDLYAYFNLENGTCQDCSPVGGQNFPSKVVWNINSQSGTTKLVPSPNRAASCVGQELNLDLPSEYNCSGVKATIISQNSSSAQVEVEVTNGHQIKPPGALYAYFNLENGTCQDCSPVGGQNFPSKVVWNINLQSGTTKLVPSPNRAASCVGQELNLDWPSEYNCWVFTLTKKSATASEIIVEAEVASTYTPMVVAPGGMYETIKLNNGECISCSNLEANGNNFPSKATWTIANQPGSTSLVFTGKAGGCANRVFQLD